MCALDKSGKVRCTGWNGHYGIGDGTASSKKVPVAVKSLSGVTQIAYGQRFGCGVQADGSNWCWGYNGNGEGGGNHKSTYNKTISKTFGGEKLRRIEAGGNHTCAIDNDGKLWCWGYNGYGQLGNGNKTGQSVPNPVVGGAQWRDIGLGANHTCAVRTDGAVYCWGYSQYGQVGAGQYGTTFTTPRVVMGTDEDSAGFAACGSDDDCADDGNPCTAAKCDKAKGQCVHGAVADGLSCFGHAQCATGGSCKSGVCKATVASCTCSPAAGLCL